MEMASVPSRNSFGAVGFFGDTAGLEGERMGKTENE